MSALSKVPALQPEPTQVVFVPMVSQDAVYAEAQAGQTVAELLGAEAAHSLRVTIGGVEVPRRLWSVVRPKPGNRVIVEFWPQGGGGARKWILTIVAIVAIVFSGGAAAGASWALVGGLSATTVVVGGALIAGLALAMIPPPTSNLGKINADPMDQLKSLTGTQNNINPYSAIPLVMGTWVYYPPHAAMPYTEISGPDQYMRIMLCLGYGDTDISDITIGSTPISSYQDVEWEITTTPTLFSQDIYEASVGVALVEVNDTATRTTQTNTTEISLDLVATAGLYGLSSNNGTVAGATEFQVEYRAVGDVTWINASTASGVTVTGGFTYSSGSTFAIRSTKREPLRAGIRWTVASGQYEVRVTRGNSSWTGSVPGTGVGGFVWSVLRSVSPQNPSTTGTKKLCVRIRATNQLSGVVSSLQVRSAQKIRSWDIDTQTFNAPAATQNPAWIALWLLTDCPGNARRFADDEIDLDGYARWAADCEANGYIYSGVADSTRVFGDVFKDVLACGMASPALRNGKQSIARDIAQTVPMNLYTPINNTSLSYERVFAEPPHALRVTFTNPQANYQQDERVVYWDGYDESNATHIEKLDLRNVSDPDAAWKIARYHLAVMWLRPTTYTVQVDAEYLTNGRGDMVEVADTIIGWGVDWGRIKSVSGDRVVLDKVVHLDPAKSYMIRVRADDATLDSTVPTPVLTWDSTHIRFDMDIDWDSTDGPTSVFTMSPVKAFQPGDLFVIGEVGKVTLPAIITAIEPGQSMLQRTAKLTLVDANPGVWTAADGEPPPFVSNITDKFWCAAPPPPVVSIWAGDSVPDDAGVIKARTGISNGSPQGGIFRFSAGGGGCPVVETPVRRMRADGSVEVVHAGDIRVGDVLQGADPITLEPMTHVVTYSETKLQPCVMLYIAGGKQMACSISAPIPTPAGLVLAPNMAGKQCAERSDDGEAAWADVARLAGLGQRHVQHISIADGCFWAGDVLHHNKQAPADFGLGRGR